VGSEMCIRDRVAIITTGAELSPKAFRESVSDSVLDPFTD